MADRLIAFASVSSQFFHFRGLIEVNQLNFNAAIRFFREGLAMSLIQPPCQILWEPRYLKWANLMTQSHPTEGPY